MTQNPPIKHVRTSMLNIAYEEHGSSNADVIILLHGFPYDPRAYDEVAPALCARGYRVIVPYLRGYGPTRFVSPQTVRSGSHREGAVELLEES
jgi:pimeloyl-ACP methyl ester carboxylesterase